MRFIVLLALISTFSYSQDITHNVYFETDKYGVTSSEKTRIDNFISSLDSTKIKHITIYGFCDDRGTETYNLALSKNRAKSIESYLVESDIPKRLLTIIDGKGEVFLQYKKKNVGKQRQNNRRVDIVVTTELEEGEVYVPPAPERLSGELHVGDKIRLKNIYFKTGYATIIPESIETLKEIAIILVERDNVYFTIEGHVCCTHDTYDAVDRKTNKRNLSVARAKFIYNYLVRKGVDKSRMKFVGMKRREPLGGNPKFDRRVEILITHIAQN